MATALQDGKLKLNCSTNRAPRQTKPAKPPPCMGYLSGQEAEPVPRLRSSLYVYASILLPVGTKRIRSGGLESCLPPLCTSPLWETTQPEAWPMSGRFGRSCGTFSPMPSSSRPLADRLRSPRKPKPECIRLSISDTWISIPEEVTKHLGILFTHGDGDLSRQHGGIGIGLALCRRLMEMHQDSLAISSTADIGTTVILTLSRRGESNAADQQPKSSSRMSPMRALTGS